MVRVNAGGGSLSIKSFRFWIPEIFAIKFPSSIQLSRILHVLALRGPKFSDLHYKAHPDSNHAPKFTAIGRRSLEK